MSTHGNFCWYELMSPDVEAAQAFYAGLLGWSAADSGTPGIDYRLFSIGGTNVAGLMAPPEGGPPPAWTGYVAVDDADAAADAVSRAGGTMHVPPTDIPNVGRFAIFTDPQGAKLAMLQPLPTDAPSVDLEAVGQFGWNELITSDVTAALDFYGPLFKWRKGEGHDMGDTLGIYQLFGPEGLGRDFGGMASMQVPPTWGYYVNVDALDAATAKVAELGGAVRQGSHQVPGGQWIAQCADPQGIAFSLVAPKR